MVGRVGLVGPMGLVGNVGLVGLLGLVSLFGLGCQVKLIQGIFRLSNLIQRYYQMEKLCLMIQKNLI